MNMISTVPPPRPIATQRMTTGRPITSMYMYQSSPSFVETNADDQTVSAITSVQHMGISTIPTTAISRSYTGVSTIGCIIQPFFLGPYPNRFPSWYRPMVIHPSS